MHILFSILACLFTGSVAVSVFYCLYFFRRLTSSKIAGPENSLPACPAPPRRASVAGQAGILEKGQTPPGVSVVVCAHNELANLQKLVPALLKQDYPHFEIVIVDDRSDDGSHDFLLSQSVEHSKIRLVRISQTPGHAAAKKHALTLGIGAAVHGIVLLTDADCLPASNGWIAGMAAHLTDERKQLVLGYSPYRPSGGLLNFMIRNETFYTAVQYLSFAVAGQPYMGVGRNLCYRKALFVRNHGFASHLNVVGGDDDLFVGQTATHGNVAVCLEPATFMVSEPKNTFRAWLRQKRRHLSAGTKYRPRHQFLLGVLSVSQILFWIAGAILLAVPAFVPFVVVGFLVRMSVQTLILRKIGGRLGHSVRWFEFWAFDFLYTVYYLSVGPWALVTKRISWN